MSHWFPVFNSRGEIASGNGELWINGRSLGAGYSPQWFDDDHVIISNPAAIVNVRTGERRALPFEFAGRSGNVCGVGAGKGAWCGWSDRIGLVVNGGVFDRDAAPGSIDRATGRLAYLTPYQADVRNIIIGGVPIRQSVAVEIRAADNAVVWREYEGGVPKTWGWTPDRGVQRLSVLGAGEFEFNAVPVQTARGLWLVVQTHTGFIAHPWGDNWGYVYEGPIFYHDAIWVNGRLEVAATDDHGQPVRVSLDLSAPRRNLSQYFPSSGGVTVPPPTPPTPPPPVPPTPPTPPEEKPVDLKYPLRLQEIIDHLYEFNKELAHGTDDQRRELQQMICEQACFELGERWGWKSNHEFIGGDPNRPNAPAKDAIAFRQGAEITFNKRQSLIVWDCFNGTTRLPNQFPNGEITNQFFVKVEPVDHLGVNVPPPPDEPTDEPGEPGDTPDDTPDGPNPFEQVLIEIDRVRDGVVQIVGIMERDNEVIPAALNEIRGEIREIRAQLQRGFTAKVFGQPVNFKPVPPPQEKSPQ